MEILSAREKAMKRLWKVRRTVMQMLRDRNYSVTDEEIDGVTIQEFEEIYGREKTRENLSFTKPNTNDSSDQISVFFFGGKVGVAEIKKVAELMKLANIFQAIVVTELNLTPQAQAAVSELLGKLQIEVFLEKELELNVTEHCLVPRHKVLTLEEKKALFERYKVNEKKIPRIMVTDPVAKYYGVRRGDVVKIIRLSENTGRYITYRYAI